MTKSTTAPAPSKNYNSLKSTLTQTSLKSLISPASENRRPLVGTVDAETPVTTETTKAVNRKHAGKAAPPPPPPQTTTTMSGNTIKIIQDGDDIRICIDDANIEIVTNRSNDRKVISLSPQCERRKASPGQINAALTDSKVISKHFFLSPYISYSFSFHVFSQPIYNDFRSFLFVLQ